MEFSWDLLETTMEKVSNVLGNTVSDIKIEQEIADSYYEMPTTVIDGNMLSPYSEYSSDRSCESLDMEDPLAEDIVPCTRERSNTWPKQIGHSSPLTDPTHVLTLPFVREEGTPDQKKCVSNTLQRSLPKKSSRRNPWGNYSYSDIIAQAISTSPEQRLTLNDIYDWMISTIPYFSERQDNAASAGWKNSIRHNLSLHQKFLKIKHEDAGKSSWWMINPDYKHTTRPRRRTNYGDPVDKSETARSDERLFKASSTGRLSSPRLPHTTEAFLIRSNSSHSSFDDDSYSPFRLRSSSNASSNSTMSSQPLPEMVIPNFSLTTETDLDNITLNDLSVEFQPEKRQSGNMIREFLNSQQRVFEYKYLMEPNSSLGNLTTAESRKNEAMGKSVNKSEKKEETISNTFNSSLFGLLPGAEILEKLDKERKKMIKNELNILIGKRPNVSDSESTQSSDNNANIISAYNMQIQLLQDELDKPDTGIKYECEG